jgi:hypothetical protein
MSECRVVIRWWWSKVGRGVIIVVVGEGSGIGWLSEVSRYPYQVRWVQTQWARL